MRFARVVLGLAALLLVGAPAHAQSLDAQSFDGLDRGPEITPAYWITKSYVLPQIPDRKLVVGDPIYTDVPLIGRVNLWSPPRDLFTRWKTYFDALDAHGVPTPEVALAGTSDDLPAMITTYYADGAVVDPLSTAERVRDSFARDRLARYSEPEKTLADIDRIEKGLAAMRADGWHDVFAERFAVLADGHVVVLGPTNLGAPAWSGGIPIPEPPASHNTDGLPLPLAKNATPSPLEQRDAQHLAALRAEVESVVRARQVLIDAGVVTDKAQASALASKILALTHESWLPEVPESERNPTSDGIAKRLYEALANDPHRPDLDRFVSALAREVPSLGIAKSLDAISK